MKGQKDYRNVYVAAGECAVCQCRDRSVMKRFNAINPLLCVQSCNDCYSAMLEDDADFRLQETELEQVEEIIDASIHADDLSESK